MTVPRPFVPEIIPGGQLPAEDQPEEHRGQLRFAERFTTAYDGRYLHAHGIGWHEFDGSRWAECRDGSEVRGVLWLVKAALREDAPVLEGEARKELLQDVQRCESAAGVSGVLDLAKNMHPCTVTAEKLDPDAHLLNTSSGTVDLLTRAARASNPDDRISKVTRARLDPDARSTAFDAFLEKIQPDPEMRAFLARSLGSSLLGRVQDHVLHIWNGEGANGKGTLRDAVRHAVGDYAVEVPADILLQSKYGQQALAPERMRLRGTRMAFCSEIANGAKLDEATMKKLTGGDPVTAKLLYRNPIEFDPSHTLFMLTNYLPTVRGDDPAVWRRILSVPFAVTVPAEDRDVDLGVKLEGAMDAVLAWLWSGWLDYQRQGLRPPAAVTEATRKYQEDSDLLARFLGDDAGQVILGMGSTRSAELYARFKRWAAAEGEELLLSNKAFTDQMEKRGYEKKRTKHGAVWQSITLADDEDEDERY